MANYVTNVTNVIINTVFTVGGGNYTFRNTVQTIDLQHIPFTNNNMHNSFANHLNLMSVININNSVVNMRNTFYNCRNLVSVPTIPNSVQDLYRTFYSCKKLTTVGPITSNSVTELPYTFSQCEQLVNAPTIPNSVTTMDNTFANCFSMVNAPTIPNSVTNMAWTFQCCNNLKNVTIPNSVVTMNSVFSGCTNLWENYPDIPQSVQNLAGMYSNINSTATSVPQWCMDKWNNCSANARKSMKAMFRYWNSLTTAPVIPDGVEDLSEAFLYDHVLNLQTVNIPDSVINMHATFNICNNYRGRGISKFSNNVQDISYCFYRCTYMTTCPDIPDSVTNMRYAFWDDNQLTTTPKISNNVVDMDSAFYDCFRMQHIPSHFPNTLIRMNAAFDRCLNLTAASDPIVIPESVEYMRETFNRCYKISNIHILSKNVKNATNCFYSPDGASVAKYVYIPFKYENGVNTTTYNTFISAGYRTDGSVCAVYLRDLNELN